MDLTYAGRAELITTQLGVMRDEFSRLWQELRGGRDLPLDEYSALYDLQHRLATVDMSEIFSGALGALTHLNGLLESHLQTIKPHKIVLVQPDEALESDFADWELAIGTLVEFNDRTRPQPDGTLFYHALKAYWNANASYLEKIRQCSGTIRWTAKEQPYFELNRLFSILSTTVEFRDEVSQHLPSGDSCGAQVAN